MVTASAPIVVAGGGLAGTLLAWRLVRLGRQVVLLAPQLPYSASAAAAGLVNSLSAKRITESWNHDLLLAGWHRFLVHEAGAAAQYWHPMPVYMPYGHALAANEWAARLGGGKIRRPVQLLHQPQYGPQLHNPWGGARIAGTGWLDVPPFLASLQAQLAATGSCTVLPAAAEWDTLDPEATVVTAGSKRLHYSTLVDCTGTWHNPWMPAWARPRPMKGQLLVVQPDTQPDTGGHMVVGDHYYLPLPDGTWAVGATYENQYANPGPDQAGLDELLGAWHRRFPQAGGAVVQHRSGLRPTTPDRKPVLGQHPDHPGLYFFNGLGTKGVLYAPWYAQVLACHICLPGFGLPREVAMQRLNRLR